MRNIHSNDINVYESKQEADRESGKGKEKQHLYLLRLESVDYIYTKLIRLDIYLKRTSEVLVIVESVDYLSIITFNMYSSR